MNEVGFNDETISDHQTPLNVGFLIRFSADESC